MRPSRKSIFVSYSHKDVFWLEQLKTMMKPLARNESLSVWDDSCIKPGADWRREIENALEVARAAVLLVSPYFLASDFVHRQLLPPLLRDPRAGDLRILWVHVSSCLYEETPIVHYQAAHDISKPLDSLSKPTRNKVLAEICREIGKAVPRSTPRCPGGLSGDAALDPLETPFSLEYARFPARPR